MRRAGYWLSGHPWVIVGVALLVIFGFWVRSTRTQPHQVRAVFSEALSLYPGLDVRVDGLDAGKIKRIENQDGNAVVTLGIKEKRFWPLHQGTTATLRYGTTIGNATRIIDLDPGPASAPALPENGIIPNKDTVETTEFDDLFNTFDAKTRAHLQGAMKAMGGTFAPRTRQLGQGIKEAGPGVQAIGGVAADVARDEPALKALVANTYRVTNTLAGRRDDISSLVSVAAATFNAFAAKTHGIQQSLERFPGAQRQVRQTLGRLDGSLDRLDGLVADLRPGAAQLGGLSRDLKPVLNRLRATVPAAVAAFRAGRAASPAITKLLEQSQPFSKQAAPAFASLAPMVACIRPYAPEIGGFLGTWSSWTQHYDAVSHMGRLWGNGGATSLTSTPPVSSEQFTKLTGQGYALVRPPGYNAGKPWFLPECGAGPEGIDPSKDPEDRR